MNNELRGLVGQNEKIMYEGKPDKTCFIFESIFNPLLPFALIWAIIDIGVIGISAGRTTFIIPFMLLHMFPVWLYLAGVIFSVRRYNNTMYIVTDRAIYVAGGVFSRTYNRKSFAELSHIDLHRGIFDQYFKVGDILASSSQYVGDKKTAAIRIDSIANYLEVYNLIKKLQEDVYTDVMYPNAKRPPENPGYNTEYKGFE